MAALGLMQSSVTCGFDTDCYNATLTTGPYPTHEHLLVSNDVHSHILSHSNFLTSVAALRDTGYLIADSGDFFEGSLEFDLYAGKPECDALGALYDVVAPGNHGFHIYERLATTTKERPAVIQSNLKGWPGLRYWISPGRTLVFGAIMSPAVLASCAQDVADRYTALEPVLALTPLVEIAKRLGASLVILSHQGFESDLIMARLLSRTGVGPSIIFSGHCHSGRTHAIVDDVHIVKGSENATGFVKVESAKWTIRVENLESQLSTSDQPHPSVAVATHSYRSRLREDPPRRLSIPRAVAANRWRLLLFLSDILAARFGTTAVLNLGAVRHCIDADFPWCSSRVLFDAFPFDDAFEGVTLYGNTALAAAVLGERYKETVGISGDPFSNDLITTDFIAERLQRLGFVLERRRQPAGLRRFAQTALLA